MGRVARFAARRRWVWAALGVLALWAALSLLTERVSLHSLSGVATSASFLLIAALGQMFVVTTGRGNIDLSMPGVITLSAFVTVIVAGGKDVGLPFAIAAVAALGLGVGLANAVLVVALRIPAIIATLATGYMLATVILLVNPSVGAGGVAEGLSRVASGRIAGVPVVALLGLGAALAAAAVLARFAYGRQISAVGQGVEAARLANVRVGRVTASAFAVSGLAAAAAGLLLSGYAGGAFLGMGAPFLLQSVGAVVLGGTLISGGSSTALGTMFGAVLMVLVVVTMQIAGLPPGAQDIVQGVVIILVLALAGGRARR